MEVRVRERLVGALLLVGIVVLLVPEILTGGPDREPLASPGVGTQSVEIQLADETPATDLDVLVPEPRAAEPAPAETAAPPEPQPQATAGAAAGAVATGPVPEQPAWAVQLGAFSTRDKAESLVADLRKRGYAAFVLEYRAAGRVLHRVRVGPEQDRSRAVAVAERLRKDGFQTVVAPHP